MLSERALDGNAAPHQETVGCRVFCCQGSTAMEVSTRLRVTIATHRLRCHEVARRAGIHRKHLSLILNDHLRPRPRTVARIDTAIHALIADRQPQEASK